MSVDRRFTWKAVGLCHDVAVDRTQQAGTDRGSALETADRGRGRDINCIYSRCRRYICGSKDCGCNKAWMASLPQLFQAQNS